MKQNKATLWVTPTLVCKPVSETFHGTGRDDDSFGGEVLQS